MPKNILIHREKEELVFQKAAQVIIDTIEANKDKKILLLLSGGSAAGTYSKIKDQISKIKNISFGQADERYFGENPKSKFQISNKTQNPNFKYQYSAEDINAYQIGKTGLWEVCKKREIPYYLVSQEGSLEQCANEYNETMKQLFMECDYKIAILGIGEDGHTAGLLPGYQKEWDKDKYVIGYEINRGQNNAGAVVCPKVFRQRITITPFALSQLDQAIVVAVGEKKRKILEHLTFNIQHLTDKTLDVFPAAILRKIKKVDLFTDQSGLYIKQILSF